MKAVKWLLAATACSVSFLANAETWEGVEGGTHTTEHTLTVLSITTDEGYTYDYTGTSSNPTVPTSYNNITNYTYLSTATVTAQDGTVTTTYTTNSVDVGTTYQSLTALSTSSDQVIQPVNQTTEITTSDGKYITPLEDSSTEYLNAGSNGLSLSTGINKTPKFEDDQYLFALDGGFNVDIVGDGGVDFFACDIAYNQSDEEIRILDANGDFLADLVITRSDWDQHIGWQQIDRISLSDDTTSDNINAEDFVGPISAIAIELSDFDILYEDENGDTVNWDYVAENAAFLEIDIPALDETGEGDPKTDYAFLFAVDTTEFNVAAVPEAQSVAYILVTFTLGMGIRRFFS